MTIKVICTGGTIDKTYFDKKSSYQVGNPEITRVLKEANTVLDYDITSFLRKDSLDINSEDREALKQLVLKSTSKSILITHGTDSIVETAKALQGIRGKTIVLTGAILPATHRDSDATFNIGCAVIAVQTLSAGVYVVMNGRVFDPNSTKKNLDKNVFESVGIE